MGRCKSFLHLLGTGDDNAVELQVTHGLGACSLGHQTVEQFLAHVFVRILADGSSCQYCLHIYTNDFS